MWWMAPDSMLVKEPGHSALQKPLKSQKQETNTQERQKGQDWKKNALTYVLAGLK